MHSIVVALVGLLALATASPLQIGSGDGLKPIPIEYPGYNILSSTPHLGGTITQYVADATTAARNSAIKAQMGALETTNTSSTEAGVSQHCGTNAVTCDGKFPARQDECLTLLNTLRGKGTPVPPDGNAGICFASSASEVCCIEWLDYAAQQAGATFDNLLPAGFQALYVCPDPDHVSAWTKDTLLGTTCTSQCMSNKMGTCTQQVLVGF